MRIFSIFAVLIALASSGLAQGTGRDTGAIQGTVFTIDRDGGHAVLPHATVALQGSLTKHTRSDGEGGYAFRSLAPGTYVISATAPGLSGSVAVEVKPGATEVAPIEMKVEAATTTVTVKASPEAAPSQESTQNVTIDTSTIRHAPNSNERIESLLPLVPGVVRGPDGRINMKGAASTQAGWLVNSANVTDPATGDEAMNLPIDVVSSIQVISNPYDPEYGRFTGAVSSVETRTGDFDKFHLKVQNLVPRPRERGGNFVGIGAFTPRLTVTGPLIKDKAAFTQAFEYRYVRTPVESLPPMQRDMKLESLDSFSQLDLNISSKQTATLSFALFPQKLDYLGLNTFTPQLSTPDLHQRGYQASFQHRYLQESGGLLISQFSYKKFDADLLGNSDDPYRLLLETTDGGFFNRQRRRTNRAEWQEIYQLSPKQFWGRHELKVGMNFAHSSYDGRQEFKPVNIVGAAGDTLERIEFGAPSFPAVDKNEIAWFGGDHWQLGPRLSFDLGLRFDHDSITSTTNTAPRAGFTLALTGDRKTLLKAGAGLFYDRVPLNIAAFPFLPDRTEVMLNPAGQATHATLYQNEIVGTLRSPRSEVWNTELDRQIFHNLLLRIAYQQRNTVHEFVVDPVAQTGNSVLSLANGGREFYREFQITGTYRLLHSKLNASYVHSRAFGDLNDFNQFFGNDPNPVIQPNQRGRLPFDAPNRFLAWGQFTAPWKIMLMPVFDLHSGFPFSTQNEFRQFVGPRNSQRFPRFSSVDLQVLREMTLPFPHREQKVKVGFGVFNLFNRFNPRDVQNNTASNRFGEFFNGVPRTFRGKFVLEF